jgi:hypothetical protein
LSFYPGRDDTTFESHFSTNSNVLKEPLTVPEGNGSDEEVEEDWLDEPRLEELARTPGMSDAMANEVRRQLSIFVLTHSHFIDTSVGTFYPCP